MPIYEYQCRKCQRVTEKIQGVQDSPLRKCPSCGGKLEKMMSPGAFVLKGSGFYATDYAHKGNDNGKGAGRGKGDGKETACPAAGEAATPACAGCPKAE
ncbi:MAG: zinc ribbon domain-containing protein [Deltaproteobacteria bacterium]|nr:zinc ribbon domain-containing protein [Deltaproteobacteria bacterium]